MMFCLRSAPRRAATIAALAVLAFAAGCSFTRPAPVKDTYLLDPANPPVAAKTRQGSLRVGTINVGAPFRARNFVIRDSELKYESDFYREFFVPPGVMLADSTARALRVARVFTRVARPGAATDTDWLLDGFAGALYADVRDPAKPVAVIQVTYYLSRDDGGATAPVWSKGYRKVAPYASSGGEAYVEALNAAFGEILAELAGDLATAELPTN
jgi:cholesterol transport system auxiliary component